MHELLKVFIQPVVIERNAEGKIVGEKVGDPIAAYTVEDIQKVYAKLEETLEEMNAEAHEACCSEPCNSYS